MFKVVIFSLAAAAVGIHSAGILTGEEKKTFISRVTLEETCDLDLNAFAVKNLSSGEIRNFKYGEAFIRANPSDYLKVVLNSDFTSVFFDGEKIQADKHVQIDQSCSSETTLNSIFDSFNDTFSTE